MMQLRDRAWNEEDHPREPAGSPEGGEFTSGGGGGGAGGGESDAAANLSSGERSKLEEWADSDKAGRATFQRMRTSKEYVALFEKLKIHEGIVYRGTAFSARKGSQKLASFVVGKTYTISKLSSASLDQEVAYRFAEGNVVSDETAEAKRGYTAVIFRMEQKTGRAVPREMAGGEQEIVIMPKTQFEITGVRDVKASSEADISYKEITMREK